MNDDLMGRLRRMSWDYLSATIKINRHKFPPELDLKWKQQEAKLGPDDGGPISQQRLDDFVRAFEETFGIKLPKDWRWPFRKRRKPKKGR